MKVDTITRAGRGIGILLTAAATAALALWAGAAAAQSVEEFYARKNITMFIGHSVGGGYDAYARTLSRHMGRHIPGNPSIRPKNRTGAGSLLLANELYTTRAQDGTALGMINRGVPMEALFGNKMAKFDPTRFNWIGSTTNEVSVCVTWHATGYDTTEEFLNEKIVMGGTGPGAGTDVYPRVLNNVIGTNFNLVTGYPGGNEINLAMEKGEVDGRCSWSWSSVVSTRPDWLKDKKVNVLLQMSTAKHPKLTEMGVPWVMDFADTERKRRILTLIYARQAMGRPVVTGPGVPEDRIAALRKAFMATMEDPKFVADIERQRLQLSPLSGEEVQKTVTEIMTSPPEIVQAAKEAAEKTGNMFVKKVEIRMVTHEGPVTQTKRGGRRIYIKHGGKEVRAKVSGSRTAVTIDGKDAKRSQVKVGMTCTFTYPGPGSEAKKVDCRK